MYNKLLSASFPCGLLGVCLHKRVVRPLVGPLHVSPHCIYDADVHIQVDRLRCCRLYLYRPRHHSCLTMEALNAVVRSLFTVTSLVTAAATMARIDRVCQ
jgi:hypothetical protein